MLNKLRYLTDTVRDDLKKKMVFVGGARQVGKTTMALSLLVSKATKNPAYLNWDILTHRQNILKYNLPLKEPVIIFDEIHKFAKWRNFLKGLYDEHHETNSFLVTGSARLDYFSKGGDSLHGRYHYYHLHPFSILEMNRNPNTKDLEQLLKFGGFPEPLFSGSEIEWARWRRERNNRVIYEDLRTLENVKEISLIDLLVESLPARVASPLSLKSLSEDLQVSHQTVERWLLILERLYMIYRIPPFGSPKIRAVKKEQKLYFWDWSNVRDKGQSFENMVASHLLKFCHFKENKEGCKMDLRFIRDTDKREIDFVVMQNNASLFAVECKSGETQLSQAIRYFKERTKIPLFYQVHMGQKDYGNEKTTGRVLPFITFCKEIGIP